MALSDVTITFSNLALEIIAGAVAAAIVGRLMRGRGFGFFGDLLFGVLGAILANFLVSYFNLFPSGYGFWAFIISGVVGSIILVVLSRLFTTGRRSAEA